MTVLPPDIPDFEDIPAFVWRWGVTLAGGSVLCLYCEGQLFTAYGDQRRYLTPLSTLKAVVRHAPDCPSPNTPPRQDARRAGLITGV